MCLVPDFAEDQYSQFQPELGNIVNFVNDWDTVPCKVNVYKTSRSRIVCTVGIRVGREDCDPVDPSTGEPYGLTSDTITCRTSAAFAGPLSAQVMVTGPWPLGGQEQQTSGLLAEHDLRLPSCST
ncbi:hypothetical protein FJT64_014579 [Amphibalanus amphitrite]|uniref:Uncharacterized protein n=1 Tax=Amphibalanus amphitrite TaxID=1232801 RepID=A0A6A4V6Y7_AMPAM|nr:hypothetical protein FJT64_014579 [Amphibalanus amphitrite]